MIIKKKSYYNQINYKNRIIKSDLANELRAEKTKPTNGEPTK
jgi:hypothetical protein